ncbi:MAG: T9SS type A sorting domain-containing protein [Candidatus Marinimicrobia bacterium]|nr:T9SS type A sorting domain-containing protein [Candidatus Neomarinimicrobiota bacterium]
MLRKGLSLFFIFTITMFWTNILSAGVIEKGDTLLIGNHKPDGSLNGALDYWIYNDVDEDGKHKHKVYELYRDSVYFVENVIRFDEDIHIVAPKPTKEKRPPVIRPGLKSDGSCPPWIFEFHESAVLKNLWITGIRPDGEGASGQWVINIVDHDGTSYTFDGLIIEAPYTGWSAVQGTGSGRSTWKILNCLVFSVGTPGIKWNGTVFCESGPGIPKDSVICRNSTFFNVGGYCADCEGPTLYGEFKNNTVVNTWTQSHQFNWIVECHVENNIFYNCYMASEDENEAKNRVPTRDVHGLVHLFELDSLTRDSLFCGLKGYDPNGDGHFTEDERVYTLKNNIYYWIPEVIEWWNNNSFGVLPQKWMPDYVKEHFFDNDEAYPNFVDSNNVNMDPQFNMTVCDPQVIIGNLNGIWDPWADGVYYFHEPPEALLTFEWPIEDYIDLSYGANFVDDEGKPIGDPRWWSEVGIKEKKSITPIAFKLYQNYPNPFNSTTSIKYEIKQRSKVRLCIVNSKGQIVRTLVNGKQDIGLYKVTWDGKDDNGIMLASGVYFCRLESGFGNVVKKMVFLK